MDRITYADEDDVGALQSWEGTYPTYYDDIALYGLCPFCGCVICCQALWSEEWGTDCGYVCSDCGRYWCYLYEDWDSHGDFTKIAGWKYYGRFGLEWIVDAKTGEQAVKEFRRTAPVWIGHSLLVLGEWTETGERVRGNCNRKDGQWPCGESEFFDAEGGRYFRPASGWVEPVKAVPDGCLLVMDEITGGEQCKMTARGGAGPLSLRQQLEGLLDERRGRKTFLQADTTLDETTKGA